MSKDARDKIAEMIETKYGKVIMKIVYGITKDYDSAEDIKQEVVLKCAMKHETLEKLHERQIYSYICTAARNTAINAREKMLRKEAEHQKYIEECERTLMITMLILRLSMRKKAFRKKPWNCLSACKKWIETYCC